MSKAQQYFVRNRLLILLARVAFSQTRKPCFKFSKNRVHSASSLLGAGAALGVGVGGACLFKQKANLVPRVLRGLWERGWQEAALWEGEKSFGVGEN